MFCAASIYVHFPIFEADQFYEHLTNKPSAKHITVGQWIQN